MGTAANFSIPVALIKNIYAQAKDVNTGKPVDGLTITELNTLLATYKQNRGHGSDTHAFKVLQGLMQGEQVFASLPPELFGGQSLTQSVNDIVQNAGTYPAIAPTAVAVSTTPNQEKISVNTLAKLANLSGHDPTTTDMADYKMLMDWRGQKFALLYAQKHQNELMAMMQNNGLGGSSSQGVGQGDGASGFPSSASPMPGINGAGIGGGMDLGLNAGGAGITAATSPASPWGMAALPTSGNTTSTGFSPMSNAGNGMPAGMSSIT
jgi:hypothetical protein